MRCRNGFVANSSSSSFIVINSNGQIENEDLFNGEVFVADNRGETKFGWENTIYWKMRDKINFAYLQTMYANNQNWLIMLEEVMKDHLGCIDIEWNITTDYNDKDGKIWSYIDHQSNAEEGENTEIFNDEETLRDFLFNPNSYIQGGNDNE